MKKIVLGILVFFFNILPIYALSFELKAVVNKTKVSVGEKVNIDVSLSNIKETSSGIASCELKIAMDDGIVIDNKVITYGNWQSISGVRGYSFDTIDAVLSDMKVFTIPVVVNKTGKVSITNIICTDIDDVQSQSDNKVISFTVESEVPSSSSSSSNPALSSKPSSSSKSSSSQDPSLNSSSSSSESSTDDELVYLADIKLTDGEINFKKDVFEYGVIVTDLDNFVIEPIIENDGDLFDISESFVDEKKTFVITVWNENNDMSKYTLYVIENENPSSSSSNVSIDDKQDYSVIFIIIIIILVLINLGRIYCKKYKSKSKKN